MPSIHQDRIFTLSADPFRRLAGVALPQLGDRVRWSKDVLSCGTWHHAAWKEPWTVTPEICQSLVDAFQLSSAAGHETTVIMVDESAIDPKTGEPLQHLDISKYKVGEVDGVRFDGRTLWVDMWTASATNPAVYQLDTQAQKVSADIRPWLDGSGNQYPLRLKHVAIVNHPVIGGQGPFVRQLSSVPIGEKKMAKARQLAAEDVPAEGEDGDGGNMFTFKEVTEALAKAGFTVPKEVTTKDGLIGWLMGAAGGGTEEEAADEMPVDMASQIGADPTGANPVQMASACRTLAKQLASVQAVARTTAKQTFEASLESHVRRGAITPAHRDQLVKQSESAGYQLSSVDLLSLIPDGAAGNAFVKTTPVARQLASAAPAKVPGESSAPTDEECKAVAQRMMKRQFSGAK